MPKKKAVKSLKKSKNNNLVLYVEDSTMKGKVFKDIQKANNFITDFIKNSPGEMDGYWIELLVTGINGDITTISGSPLEVSYK